MHATYNAGKLQYAVNQFLPFGEVRRGCYYDALANVTEAAYDYRVLQPYIITDPNGNSQSVAFDVLGMVIKKAVAGKNGEGDTLNDPTETYSYDLQAWINNDKPVYAHVSKREKHADAGCRWLQAYVYTDGLGNEIMTKTQAADGLAWTMQGGVPVEVQTNDRWLASGKIILNNKGKAVKQYEPWYSTTYEFEDEELLTNYGVTPVMHYDPLSRLIQTDFPDNTTARVEFDVWQQRNHDQNDCDTSSAHYNTPQVIDLDVLGRAFQINDDNGNTTTHEFYTTHNQLDITGRIVQVTDALERIMTVNVYALSEKHQLKVQNIDSATRWMLNDTLGNPRYVWDSRDHRIKTLYDALLRPTQMLLKTGNNPEITTQQIIYGTSAALNNIGQIIEIDAQDGKTNFAYDFKGNVSGQIKQFAEDYQNELDWNGTVTLLNALTIATTYDALNRPVTVTQPNATVETRVYAKGGMLNAITYNNTNYITGITYNARGQRESIYYGNNSKTQYTYNTQNFRLIRLLTTRNSGADVLQDLNYTYDAVGNIIGQTDNAQQTFYFNNQVVAPTGTYTYDALYRLLTATGREQTALAMPTDSDFVNNIPCPDTATTAMQNYTHNYQYDALGNMLQMQSVGKWTRNYDYNNPMTNNYLIGHGGGTVYTYDTHGNMLTMTHLTTMAWDYLDQLHSAANGTFTSYYNYDAEGNRSRKVVIKNNIREERYYIGDYEVYRKYINNVIDTERTTLNINDDEKRFAIIDTLTVSGGQTITPVVTIRYQYDNHLGSACLELDELAAIISYEEYHPFGTTSYRSGRSTVEVSLKRYKYCGKERDEETGLYYYGMRYYAAWICRFVSVDPLQFKYPHYTPYQYAGNRPITMIDMDGTEPEDPHKQKTYTVQKGDTPSGIAEKTGISIWNLAKWNQGEQEGGGFFGDIGKGNYNQYWIEGKGTSWSIKPGDVLDVSGLSDEKTTQTRNIDQFRFTPVGGQIESIGLLDPLVEGITYLLSKGFQKMGVKEQTADIAAGITLFAASIYFSHKAPSMKIKTNITKNEAPLYRYMTSGELKAIQETGYLRGGLSGETYFTKDLYKTAAKAQTRLSLSNPPTLRVEFKILNKPTLLKKGTKVKPLNDLIGGGSEFMTLDLVKVKLINWQPLK